MADRNYFYFKQRVTDDEMRAAFDGPELAIWNFAKDLGVFGISTGGDVTEQSPVTGLYVDIDGPFIGYTQDGKRVFFGTDKVVDCSVDYLGNPTVPTNVGESRWISIHARFDRALSDQRVDGNGSIVYWVQSESYELRVVSGVAAGGGGHAKPDLPTDAILVCDIELTQGQTTIVQANIDESRKNTLVLATADAIGVSAGSWTQIDGASQHVQDALDSIDALLIDRDGTGKLDEDLIPAAGRSLGSAVNPWAAIYVDSIDISTIAGDLTIDGNLAIASTHSIIPADATGQDLGAAGFRWDVFASSLDVAGPTQLTGAVGIDGDTTVAAGHNILPTDATGQDLGSSGARWDVFGAAGDINSLTVNTSLSLSGTVATDLIPAAHAQDLGSSGARWDAYLQDVTIYNANTFQYTGGRLHQVVINAQDSKYDDALLGGWAKNGSQNGVNTSSSSNIAFFIYLNKHLPDGAVVTGIEMYWSQASNTTMYMQLSELPYNSTSSPQVGSNLVIGGTGYRNDTFSTSFTIDKSAKDYELAVWCGPTVTDQRQVANIRITYTITDIAKAIGA